MPHIAHPLAHVLAGLIALAIQAADAPGAADPPGCWIRGDRADLELRISPYDSATVEMDDGALKVCYSRPRMLGRPIMGRLVPYGEAWRLGANEATAIHVPTRATIAGVAVEPGWYSLYAVPGEREWRIVVNRLARRWGVPIGEEVQEADVGSGTVPASAIGEERESVEMLTLGFERTGSSSADLVVGWDRTSVRVPILLRDGTASSRSGSRP